MLPVRVAVQVTNARVDKGGEDEVVACRDVGGDCGREGGGGEHVHVSALHVGGCLAPGRQQLQDARGHLRRPRGLAASAARRACEAVEMNGGVVVELEGSGERVENLLGRMLVASLLEAHVVVAAY